MTSSASDLDGRTLIQEFRATPVVTLRDIVGALWPRWRLIGIVSAAGGALAVLYLILVPPKYEVTLTVAPVRTSQSLDDEQSSLLGAGGLLGKAQPTKFDIYAAELQSVRLADRIERKYHILPRIFPDQWDAEHQRWLPSKCGPMCWVRWALGWPDRRPQPTAYDLAQYLTLSMTISQPDDSGARTLTIYHKDPVFARSLLRALDREADEMLREHQLAQAEGYIAYISAQLEKASGADQRSTLVSLLLDQQKAKMQAGSDLPYAAWEFDGPTSSPLPKKPNIPVLILFGLIAGGIIGIAIVATRHYRAVSRSWDERAPSLYSARE